MAANSAACACRPPLKPADEDRLMARLQRFGGMRMPPSIEGVQVLAGRALRATDSAACACRPPLKDYPNRLTHGISIEDSAACACRPPLKQDARESVRIVDRDSAACACRPPLKEAVSDYGQPRRLASPFGGMRMPPSIEGRPCDSSQACEVQVADSAACACRPPLKDGRLERRLLDSVAIIRRHAHAALH